MSDSRPRALRPPLYYNDGTAPRGPRADTARRHPKGADETGWDAYRKWLATAGRPERTPRAPIDRSVYSWKGYHNWADRIKQQWKNDDS